MQKQDTADSCCFGCCGIITGAVAAAVAVAALGVVDTIYSIWTGAGGGGGLPAPYFIAAVLSLILAVTAASAIFGLLRRNIPFIWPVIIGLAIRILYSVIFFFILLLYVNRVILQSKLDAEIEEQLDSDEKNSTSYSEDMDEKQKEFAWTSSIYFAFVFIIFVGFNIWFLVIIIQGMQSIKRGQASRISKEADEGSEGQEVTANSSMD